MDSLMLRDEAARNRVRQAEEFLDPSELLSAFWCYTWPPVLTFPDQTIKMRAATDLTSS